MIRKMSLPPIAYALLGIALLSFPLLNDSRSALILVTQIFIFAVFAMSYDLLLGYTGIISFGHAMFFGLGAYTVGIWMNRNDETLGTLILAVVVTVVLCGLLGYVLGIVTLRLKSHFYAMLTLAVAGLFQVGAEKWRSLTMGNDGFTFGIPEWLMDRQVFYYLAFAFMVGGFLFLRRFTQSPLGRVLQAIRENEHRAESLGYRVLHYKVISSVVAGIVAGLAGLMYGLSLRFVNTGVFGVDITLDGLLMTIIGGVGTLSGAIIGAALIQLAHDWLTDLAQVHWLFERWIILFGIVYILAVRFFPQGIVGTIRRLVDGWKERET